MQCPHYVRFCEVWCNACQNFFKCRLCHDAEIQQKCTTIRDAQKLLKFDHNFDRYNVPKIRCTKCNEIQTPGNHCVKCNTTFGNYYCDVCNLWQSKSKKENENVEIFHCNHCGMCRLGDSTKFEHCHKCCMCLSKEIYASHKCFENSFKNGCAVCFENLATSTTPVTLTICGHSLHTTCLLELLQSGEYRCPNCKKSMVDMSATWDHLGNLYANIDTSGEKQIEIICHDCEKKSTIFANGFGIYKCLQCNGFNVNLS